MLDIDVAGLATVTAAGSRSSAPRRGFASSRSTNPTRSSGSSSAADEKFAAQNAASWGHGLLVHVPKGVELEQPLYVRIANPPDGGALFWRLLVIAEPGSRFA